MLKQKVVYRGEMQKELAPNSATRQVQLLLDKERLAIDRLVSRQPSDRPICKYFLQGTCKFGESCRYRHVSIPTRTVLVLPGGFTLEPSAPSLCEHYHGTRLNQMQSCNFGENCRFTHIPGLRKLQQQELAQLGERVLFDLEQHSPLPEDNYSLEHLRYILRDGIKRVYCNNNYHTVILTNSGEVFFVSHDLLTTASENNAIEATRRHLLSARQIGLSFALDNERIADMSTVSSIFLGISSYWITESGYVYSNGTSQYGQLGQGGRQDNYGGSKIESPQPFAQGEIVQVSSGMGHALFLDRNGTCWAAGNNEYGQLGLGQSEEAFFDTPRRAECFAGTVLKRVRAGKDHSMFLTETGDVYTCGMNRKGECGVHPGERVVYIPTRLTTLPCAARDIFTSGNSEFSVILLENDEVYVMGNSHYGQLGVLNGHVSIPTPMPIPVESKDAGGIREIAVSAGNIAIITSNKVFATGINDHQQITEIRLDTHEASTSRGSLADVMAFLGKNTAIATQVALQRQLEHIDQNKWTINSVAFTMNYAVYCIDLPSSVRQDREILYESTKRNKFTDTEIFAY